MKTLKQRLNLPTGASALMKRVYDNGYEIYVVGGFVRDSFLSKAPSGDVDFTTNMLPAQTKALFADCHVIDTGIKNGTVTVVFDGMPYEITTYRSDGSYDDARHPREVSFVSSLKEDLSRRDFTINALCYFEKDNDYGIVDMFNGIADIEKEVIITIGDPYQRFCEDALRILRAYRFMATLNFTINHQIRTALHQNSHLLSKISAERKTTEFIGILKSKQPSKALLAMKEDGVLTAVFGDAFKTDGEHFAAIDRAEGLTARLAIFSKGQADCAVSSLSLDKKTIAAIRLIEAEGDILLTADKISLKKRLSVLKKEGVRLLFEYQKAMGKTSDFKAVYSLLEEIYTNGECYCLKQLKISGDDVKAEVKGVDGILIGSILSNLLCEVIEGKLENEKSVLVNAINKMNIMR